VGWLKKGFGKLRDPERTIVRFHFLSIFPSVVAIETDGGVEGRTGLFGVDIKELTKHEGVESKHGIDPKNAKEFRIPEFLDHVITALKQSGAMSRYTLSAQI